MVPFSIGRAMGRVAYICGDGSSRPGTTLNSTLARFASYFGTVVSLLADGSYFFRLFGDGRDRTLLEDRSSVLRGTD